MFYQFSDFLASFNRFTERAWQVISSPIGSLSLWWAILHANRLYSQTGVRHYVIPGASHHKLLVCNFNTEIHSQGLSQTKLTGRHYRRLDRPADLMQQAFYWTPSHRCQQRWRKPMPPATQRVRRSMFYSWWNTRHNTK